MGSSNYAIRLLSVAEQDLQELISYLAAENPGAAAIALDRIETQLQGLQRHPFLGRTPNDPKLARLGYRVLVIDNYLAFYKVKGKTVLIHRVLHGARDFVRLLMD
ncbi:MAG: type II toxin-antitoxin system RelE/ParE family toxin [Nitrospira defluvii]|nr:type II toxin-antitoxin system RelE/ParE family toxin [Nitrospira defluvii]